MNSVVDRRIELQFDDNALVPMLYGPHDSHLARVESQLGVQLVSRGNRLTIAGPAASVEVARSALDALWQRLKKGLSVDAGDVDGAVRLAGAAGEADGHAPAQDLHLRTKRRTITPRSPAQAVYLKALTENEMVFGLGPAGTGKTYLAVAQAVTLLLGGEVDRIILSRPAVEAGERLGFLPGDMKEKVDPYLRPLYDALYDMMPADQVVRRMGNGEIEIAPLAFMRGRTLANAFVILDEAQNTTPMQMKMLLTRLGDRSRMVITGDLSQTDLPKGQRSGLQDALDILQHVNGIAFVRFTEADVVRHPLVARIVRAYDAHDRTQSNPGAAQGAPGSDRIGVTGRI